MKTRILTGISILLSSFSFSQNIVCLDIVANPNPDDPALTLLTKYIDVFGIGIYAEAAISDEKVKHTAAIFAEWLDNDEDGVVDDPLILAELLEREALMPVFTNEGSAGEAAFFENYMGEGVGAVLYEGEIITTRPLVDNFDATLEENLHTISSIGYANAYPLAFAEGETDNSRLTIAMDSARAGHFVDIPATYPERAWYHYDDETCAYNCMATEYFYWGLTSMLGIQDYGSRCAGIAVEWEACTALEFETMDTALFNLFSNPTYNIPTSAPDGNYCPGNIGILDFEIPISKINVYPNPSKDQLIVKTQIETGIEIEIFDYLGKKVKAIDSMNSQVDISLNDLPNGTYFLVVNNQFYEKFVVLK